MSQVFQADGVVNAGPVACPLGTPTQVVVGNFLTPPFGTCKALVQCQARILTGGTTSTGCRVQIFRNPSAENVQVYDSTVLTQFPVQGEVALVGAMTSDSIPDGRPVQYAMTITLSGTGAAGSASTAAMQTILISG